MIATFGGKAGLTHFLVKHRQYKVGVPFHARSACGVYQCMHILCVLLFVWDSELATHPYSSDMDTHQLTANSSIAALFLADMSSNKFAFVGERASGRFYWSSPLAAKQSPKSSRVCKFQEVQMLSKSQNKCWKYDYNLALLTMLSALRHG